MNNQAFDLLKESIDDLKADIRGVKEDVKEISTDLGHYKGFVGGIMFVFTMAWAALTFFWDKFGSHDV